jgi:phospho-N-acetylmuramoyl-pentapeptide-transferase
MASSAINGIDAAVAGLVPLGLSLLFGQRYIDFLKKRYMGQYIREDGPQSHHSKAGTPTAGGVLILASFLFGTFALYLLLGASFLSISVLLVIGVTLLFGLLGFVDDYLKISKKKNKGVSGYTKLVVQILAGAGVGFYMMQVHPAGPVNIFNFTADIGWLYPVFAALVITATSNAVNLTDGLDGLASGTAVMAFMATSLILAATGQGNLALLCHAMAGACVGFLAFNHHPARIFMGDTGSLALGGALGTLAVVGGLDFWLVVLGAIFVLEALSVILQVISFKTTGKRIFRMSPLHHHFELGGWKETKVVYSFVTFQFFCAVVAVFLYNRG